MKVLVVCAAVLGVILLIREFKLRKNTVAPPPPGGSERLMMANEAPPTETGRLRAAEIVRAIKAQHPVADTAPERPERPEPEPASTYTDDVVLESDAESVEPLPDPFHSGK